MRHQKPDFFPEQGILRYFIPQFFCSLTLIYPSLYFLGKIWLYILQLESQIGTQQLCCHFPNSHTLNLHMSSSGL